MKRTLYPKTTQMSFYNASSPIILFGQFFGQMLVYNISSASPYDLGFKWSSLRTIYSIVFLIFVFLYICCDIHYFMLNGMSLNLSGINLLIFNWKGIKEHKLFLISGSIIFHVVCFASTIILFWLAINWRKVMVYWTTHEQVFLNLPYQTTNRTLSFRLNVITGLMLLMTFGMN